MDFQTISCWLYWNGVCGKKSNKSPPSCSQDSRVPSSGQKHTLSGSPPNSRQIWKELGREKREVGVGGRQEPSRKSIFS
jgi:hypothetical protein